MGQGRDGSPAGCGCAAASVRSLGLSLWSATSRLEPHLEPRTSPVLMPSHFPRLNALLSLSVARSSHADFGRPVITPALRSAQQLELLQDSRRDTHGCKSF